MTNVGLTVPYRLLQLQAEIISLWAHEPVGHRLAKTSWDERTVPEHNLRFETSACTIEFLPTVTVQASLTRNSVAGGIRVLQLTCSSTH